ncbi:MAG: DUF1015 domain-containing protein [bacterium]
MVTIKAFKGLRAMKGKEEQVASIPYDVVDSNEARRIAKDNPYSFLHIAKPEIDLDPEIDCYSRDVYEQGKRNLNRFIEKEIFVQDKNESLYIYKLKKGDHEQTGLLACTSVGDYTNEIIKKHEQTMPEKELDRINHINILNAHTEPVFMTYRADEEIDETIDKAKQKEPEYNFTTDDGVSHVFFTVDEQEKSRKLIRLFKGIETLYIADGHHRSASAARVAAIRRKANPHHNGNEEYNYFLSIIFPHNQLCIMDYNRAVKDLYNHSVSSFIRAVTEKFEIIDMGSRYKPVQKHTMGMYLGDRWYKLVVKDGTFEESDPVNQLDVHILQKNLLDPVLKITDPRTDHRIDFIGGSRGLDELERRVNCGEYKVAFAMYPTTIEELMTVSDRGEIMPPKSTWFDPKPRSGLVIHQV